MKHEIIIENWRPAALNEFINKHWTVGHKRKKQDRGIIAAYCMKYHTPPATGKRMVTLEITLSGMQKEADIDAYQKSTLDALVKAKMLVDDTAKWAEWEGVIYKRGEFTQTIITLEDL